MMSDLTYNLPLDQLDAAKAVYRSQDGSVVLTVPREHWESRRLTTVLFTPTAPSGW